MSCSLRLVNFIIVWFNMCRIFFEMPFIQREGGNVWVSALLYNITSLFGIAALIFFFGVSFGVCLRAKFFSRARVRFACSFLFVLISFCVLRFLTAVHAFFLISSLTIGFAGLFVGFEKRRMEWKRLFFRLLRSRKKDITPISVRER